MNIMIDEWDKTQNAFKERVAIWGDGPEYPEHIRSIVNDIINHGCAVRGDVIYYNHDDQEDEEVTA